MKDLTTFLDQQKPGFSLSQPFYTHQQIFDLEWQHIWKKYWLFAGTTAEIPKPGDYFTFGAQNDSIIIIRGNQGEVFAHYNTCRHRGSLICLEEKGNAPKLMCPYHQWVYDKDGIQVDGRKPNNEEEGKVKWPPWAETSRRNCFKLLMPHVERILEYTNAELAKAGGGKSMDEDELFRWL